MAGIMGQSVAINTDCRNGCEQIESLASECNANAPLEEDAKYRGTMSVRLRKGCVHV